MVDILFLLSRASYVCLSVQPTFAGDDPCHHRQVVSLVRSLVRLGRRKEGRLFDATWRQPSLTSVSAISVITGLHFLQPTATGAMSCHVTHDWRQQTDICPTNEPNRKWYRKRPKTKNKQERPPTVGIWRRNVVSQNLKRSYIILRHSANTNIDTSRITVVAEENDLENGIRCG